MSATTTMEVNGRQVVIAGDQDRPLLDALRETLGVTATRFGCGSGHCGACKVLVNGRAETACNTPLWSVEGRDITTVEGLGNDEHPHPLQQAFIDEQAMQCGYCISGILISAAALLSAHPSPDDASIRAALDGHLCRCGAHGRIIRAVKRAAAAMQAGSQDA